MRTQAVRDGDGWHIKGTKHFISHAQESDFVILFAVTDAPGDRQKRVGTPTERLPARGISPSPTSTLV